MMKYNCLIPNKFPFHDVEYMFHAVKYMFYGMEHTFHVAD